MYTYKLLWVKVKPQKMPQAFSSLIFGIPYFLPCADYCKALINQLHTSINKIRQTNMNRGIVLLGNFNNLNRRCISQSLDLKQVVRVPITEKSAIDLIFTDVGEFYHPPESGPSLGKSTHFLILWKPKNTMSTAKKETIICRPPTAKGKTRVF